MAVAWADPATVDVFANTRYSDNIDKRASGSEEEDFEHRVGIGINKQTGPGTCEAAIGGDMAFVTYQRGTNSDEVSADLDASGNCQPNRNVRWSARGSIRDVRTTTQAPDSPNNRERRNFLATGPSFIAYPSRRDTLTLDMEYQMTRFQESTEDDSDRVVTTGRWQHLFTRNLNGGLAASQSNIDYRQTEEELVRRSANGFFNWQRGNGSWSGELGYSWLESEQGPLVNDTEGATGQLAYRHQWGQGTSAFAEFRRSITDVSSEVDLRIPGLDFNLTQTSAVVVTAFTVGAGQQWTERTRSDLSVSATESDYEASGTTEERLSSELSVSHRLMQNLTGQGSAGFARETFGQNSEDERDTVRAQLGLDYQRTRDLTLSASIGHETQSAELPGAREYDENWIQFGVRYNLR
ncbi:outer membrane beta-barrel protein [Halovibrio salipaludis]|nr:outer membrane beta-barrel protein [Halovibrio salipaludis]